MTLRDLFSLVATDIERYIDDSPFIDSGAVSRKTRLSVIIRPEIICIFLYRLSHLLYLRRQRWLAGMIAGLNRVLHKVNIHPASRIGSRLRLPHPAGVTFEGHAGDNLTVFSLALCLRADRLAVQPQSADTMADESGFPILGDNVVLGGQSAVIGRIHVGDDVTVAYRAIVTESIQSESLVFSSQQKLKITDSGSLSVQTNAFAQ